MILNFRSRSFHPTPCLDFRFRTALGCRLASLSHSVSPLSVYPDTHEASVFLSLTTASLSFLAHLVVCIISSARWASDFASHCLPTIPSMQQPCLPKIRHFPDDLKSVTDSPHVCRLPGTKHLPASLSCSLFHPSFLPLSLLANLCDAALPPPLACPLNLCSPDFPGSSLVLSLNIIIISVTHQSAIDPTQSASDFPFQSSGLWSLGVLIPSAK